jgi:AcrR family transcriptional regulator
MATPSEARKAQTYHHGDLKTALRTEAERILVERGVDDVGLREIARALGVSHNAPYRHYENRAALLADIAAGGFRRLKALVEQAAAGDDPRWGVIDFGHKYIRFAMTEPAIFRLMMGKELSKPQYVELKTAADGVFEIFCGMLVAIGIPAPAIPQGLALWSLVHGMAILLLDDRIEEHGGAIDVFAIVTDFTTTYLDGLGCGGRVSGSRDGRRG